MTDPDPSRHSPLEDPDLIEEIMPTRRPRALSLCLPLLVLPLVACVPEVDLGGDPDAATPSGDSGGPGADAGGDAGSPVVDAGDGGPGGTGEVTIRARDMLLDVFDRSSSILSFDLEVTVDDPSAARYAIRPLRYEILASDGSVLDTYPLTSDPLPFDALRGGLQRYRGFLGNAPGGASGPLLRACDDESVVSRFLRETIRVVVEVDGVEHNVEQFVPAGTGGLPPMRPFALCHEGLRVERSYEGFHDGVVDFRLRPDGLYDLDLWASLGGATYTHAPIRSVDPEVRIAPMSARHWAGDFPVVRVAMDAPPCPGCGVEAAAMGRYLAGQPSVPVQLPSTRAPYWCAEPFPGQVDFGEPWPPSGATPEGWLCRSDGAVYTGDGGGIASFSGTTDDGPFRVELFLFGASWRYGDSLHP